MLARRVDWRAPPADLRVPVIFAADLLYEIAIIAPLVVCIQQMLTPGGLCLLADIDRVPAPLIREALQAAGLPFTTKMMRAGEPGGHRVKGTLYRIGCASAKCENTKRSSNA